MQRRLELIILAHIWALAPLALIWLSWPAWRGTQAPVEVQALSVLAAVTAAYLLTRTWMTVTWRWPQTSVVWPYLDAALVTAALLAIGSPEDAISVLYFIPIASAVASLRLGRLVTLAVVTIAAYALVVIVTQTAWTVPVIFRLAVIGITASLYGWMIRTVTMYERAAERAEYQTELAREIHDGIQHLLVTLGARLELAGRLIPDDPVRAERIVAEERDTVVRAGDELRYLVRRLRTDRQHADLASALRAQVGALSDRWPFILDVEVPPALPRLSPAAEHAMLRVIQESVTNAAKHAQASAVEIQIAVDGGVLRCAIHDNGSGFDPAAASTAAAGGLQGLRERVTGTGGTFSIESAPAGGTTVTAIWPLSWERAWMRSGS